MKERRVGLTLALVSGVFMLVSCAEKTNLPPVADAGPDQVVSLGHIVTLDGGGSSDPYDNPLTYSWSLTSLPSGSKVSLNNPNIVYPSFTPDVEGSYEFKLVVNNGVYDSSNPATVTISAAQGIPVANAGADQNVITGIQVQLDGSGSFDPETDLLSYSWAFLSLPAGSGAVLNDPNVVNPSFLADGPGSYVVQLIVTDSTGLVSPPDSVTITASTCGSAVPVADAGAGQAVNSGATVQLDGSASDDADTLPPCSLNQTLSYSWAFFSLPTGSSAVLNDPNVVGPSFLADVPGNYVVRLIVTDSTGLVSPPDSVTITASTCGSAVPVADAGAGQAVNSGDTVQLDGSASYDADTLPPCSLGQTITYSWGFVSLPGGSSAVLNDPNVVGPSFLTDVPGSYVVQLIVTDSTGLMSPPDAVTITASTCGSAVPVADAGAGQAVNSGDTVQLDGSASDDADNSISCSLGQTLTYLWFFSSLPLGSSAVINSPEALNPSFVADVPGDYVVRLVVTDSTGLMSPPDSVTITASTCGSAVPVADAGAGQAVNSGDTVQLDGSASDDADNSISCSLGQTLTYLWFFSSLPLGSSAVINSPEALNPSFVADVPGSYVVQLIVTDSTGLVSPPDAVTITASTCGSAVPVADAGAGQAVNSGDTVQLDGSASYDPDNLGPCSLNQTLTYSWAFVSIPAGSGAVLNDPNVVNPSFLADGPGSYVVQLIVTDSTGLVSPPDAVTIFAGDCQPVAVATTSTPTLPQGDVAVLNGHSSYSPCGRSLTYSWAFVSLPAGSSAVLNDPNIVDPSFVADVLGLYEVRLVVTDSAGLTSDPPVTVTVSAVKVPATGANYTGRYSAVAYNFPPGATISGVTTCAKYFSDNFGADLCDFDIPAPGCEGNIPPLYVVQSDDEMIIFMDWYGDEQEFTGGTIYNDGSFTMSETVTTSLGGPITLNLAITGNVSADKVEGSMEIGIEWGVDSCNWSFDFVGPGLDNHNVTITVIDSIGGIYGVNFYAFVWDGDLDAIGGNELTGGSVEIQLIPTLPDGCYDVDVWLDINGDIVDCYDDTGWFYCDDDYCAWSSFCIDEGIPEDPVVLDTDDFMPCFP